LERESSDLFLDMVIRGALDVSSRVEGLLVEARADVQSRDLAPVDLDLAGFVEPIVRAFDAVNNHQMRAEVEHGLTAFADPIALQQVLGHLLDNAVKYAPGHGTIKVVGYRTHDGVAIAVVDEGPGLPGGFDVFEAFRRGDPDEIGGAPGIGLGLHIVRKLTQAMGGSVGAAANAEGGATFTVSLPATPKPTTPTGPRGHA
jgi:signal transduction histidine kinase